MLPSRLSYVATIALFGIFSSACEKESSEGPKPLESAAPQKQALDPELAQAVAAASARARGQSPAEAQAGGPPPTGIFAPGAADREAQKGAPPKITLGAEGSEPRVSLQPAQPKPGTKTNGSIQVELQSDPRQGGIPIDFALTLEAQKPKEASDAPGPVTVIARVNNAGIALNGAPPELTRNIGKLKGTKVEYQVLPDGGGTGFKFELAKGSDANLEDSVRALSDALAVITLPYPEKPVGVGADDELAAVQPRRAHLDEHLPRPGDRLRDLARLEARLPAFGLDVEGLHSALIPASRISLPQIRNSDSV